MVCTTRSAVALLVALTACSVSGIGQEGAFDLDGAAEAEDAGPIDELSDADTDADMQSFNAAYDNTLVDKVVDKDFDPDKMFADMEQLGESQARQHMAADDPKGPNGPGDEIEDEHLNRNDVNEAADELQQSADLAMNIARHPSRFHDLVTKSDHGLGESDDMSEFAAPKAAEAHETKAEAEEKLKESESAVRAYGIVKSEKKEQQIEAAQHAQEASSKESASAESTQTAAGDKAEAAGKDSKASDPVGGNAAPTPKDKESSAKQDDSKNDNSKKAESKKDVPAAGEKKADGSAGKQQDPTGGSAIPSEGQRKKHATSTSATTSAPAKESVTAAPKKAQPDTKAEAESKLDVADEAVKAYGVNKAEKKGARLDALKIVAEEKHAASKTAVATAVPEKKADAKAEVRSKPAADTKAKEETSGKAAANTKTDKKDAAPEKKAGSKSAAPGKATADPKSDKKAAPAKKADAKAEAPAKNVAGAPKKDYYMEAAKAMQSGMPANKLLAIAKKAFTSGNREKARAYLAAAEETQEKKEKVDDKPKENLLDILRRKQGHAVTMNAASVAATRAATELRGSAKKVPKVESPQPQVPTSAHNKVKASTIIKQAAGMQKSESEVQQLSTHSDDADDDAEKEAHAAETALLETQKAAQLAIAKAKARVAAAKARTSKRRKAEIRKMSQREVSHHPDHKIRALKKAIHEKEANEDPSDSTKTKKHLQKDAMKLQKGALKKATGPSASKDAFGFSRHDHHDAQSRKRHKEEDKTDKKTAPTKEDGKPQKKKTTDAKTSALPGAETFGFTPSKQSNTNGTATSNSTAPAVNATAVANSTQASEQQPTMELGEGMSMDDSEHAAMESADDLNIWVNGKPIDSKALKTKEQKAAKVAKAKSSENAEKKRLLDLSPRKEMSEKKAASMEADDLHVWVNGRPVVTKTAASKKEAVVKPMVEDEAAPAPVAAESTPSQLGETNSAEEAEGLESMRSMKLIAKHVVDSSKSVDMQNKISPNAEYAFSIKNTNAHDQSMGVAKNVHLDVKLPHNAKLQDAYFYLEAKGNEEPESQNCKLNHAGDGDGLPQVNCVVSSVKDIVDVYVRAHYDGDEAALSKLTGEPLDATLHEGHEVLTTAQVEALQKAPLLKRMHHD